MVSFARLILFLVLVFCTLASWCQDKIITKQYKEFPCHIQSVSEYSVQYTDEKGKDQIISRDEVHKLFRMGEQTYDHTEFEDLIIQIDEQRFNCLITSVRDQMIYYQLEAPGDEYGISMLDVANYWRDGKFYESDLQSNSVGSERNHYHSNTELIISAGEHLEKAGRQLNRQVLVGLVALAGAVVFYAVSPANAPTSILILSVGTITNFVLFLSGNSNIKKAGTDLRGVR